MATSQLLRDLLEDKALIVSSNSENKIFSLQKNKWSSINVEGARGIAVGDEYVVVAGTRSLYYYEVNSGNSVGTLNVSSQNIHEICFTSDNSLVACSSYESALTRHAFGINETIWTVPEVDINTSDGRSWLSGITTLNGTPKYVTALGISNAANGWRNEAKAQRGALIDIQNNEIVLHDLFFPHSPTIIGDDLWFANSGHGQICKWSPGDSSATVIANLSGWTRGIVQIGEYLLVGISQGRMTAFPEITSNPLAQPGIAIIEISTGNQVDFESFDVREIFDIKITNAELK
jgi:uncharacterized protein (TIGR03032 family)